jgi:uncharacterized protein (DUF2252 family)
MTPAAQRPAAILDDAAVTPEERRARGRAARKSVPRSSHAEWARPAGVDPVAILEGQAATRVPELVPLRYRRMLASAFTFYRGGAAIMAADLDGSPDSGLRAQLCGDAHLSNFGGFAAPDRRLVLDCNDFDETLPGPWEWDLKRLAVSFEIAGRDRGFKRLARREVVAASVASYAREMSALAELGNLELRYLRADAETLIAEYADSIGAAGRKVLDKNIAKATAKTRMRALAKLTERVDGELRIRSQRPVLTPLREFEEGGDAAAARAIVESVLQTYIETLSDENRHLMRSYRFIDAARKVVGVGSVGTRAWIVLMLGRDDDDPLFLQVKEAEASVLEPYVGASEFANHGHRVVAGQRLMQAAGDVMLGWTTARIRRKKHDFYVRQLWDQKASASVELMEPPHMKAFAEICGTTLARAHARSGDGIAIAGYLGRGTSLALAMVEFAALYADQNEGDYEEFAAAIDSGRLEVAPPEDE